MIQKFHIWVFTTKELKAETQADICTLIFYNNVTYNSQQMEMTQSVHKWMNEHNLIYMCNKILFRLKSNEILTNATTWMKLGETILNEISQSQRNM